MNFLTFKNKIINFHYFSVFSSLQLQFAIEAIQSGPQDTRVIGSGVPGALSRILREKSEVRDSGHARAAVQRHVPGNGRLRSDVLRPRL